MLFPFHRNDNYLRDSIESILGSTYLNLRLILIDDRKDKLVDVSKLIGGFKRYEYVTTDGAQGYGEALRVGTQLVTSEFVALMNSDDIVSPLRFITQLKLLEDSEISICKMSKIDSKNNKIAPLTGDISGLRYDPLYLTLGAYGANASWCMHSDWWRKNAFFDSSNCLDWRIALGSFNTSKISYSKETLYYYRRHSNQVTNNTILSINEMRLTFNSWNDFVSRYDLPHASYEVFCMLAAPWNRATYEFDSEYFSYSKKLKVLVSQKHEDISKNFIKIVRRRDLFATKNAPNFLIKSILILNSRHEFFSVLLNLVVNTLKKFSRS